MKVLHLPSPVGGNSWGLASGEKKIGLDSTVLYRENTWINYPGDIILPHCNSGVQELIKLLKTTVKIYGKYDVYHFNFGSSLIDFPEIGLNLLDIPLYRNKKTVVTYNGCDARQKYARMKQAPICCCNDPLCYNGICNDIKVEEQKRRRIKRFEEMGASFCSVNPDLMNFLPANTTFLPYSNVWWDKIELPTQNHRDKITIVHAPTNRAAKGSDQIITVLKKIERNSRGKVCYKLIEGVPHEEALKLYMEADIAIDQIKTGWYGGFAVEVMKMGIPVIAYINEDDLHFIPNAMANECTEALINANEFTLESVLNELIDNPLILERKRVAQIEYAKKWHDVTYVAGIVKEIYER